MTSWLKEMQKTYPDLKLTLPFCTQEYMYNGQGYYRNFPENIQIVMTGGRVWGEVTNDFTTTFTNNVGRGPYMWINCFGGEVAHILLTFAFRTNQFFDVDSLIMQVDFGKVVHVVTQFRL